MVGRLSYPCIFWAKSWFGFRLHLIVDADYELPVGFDLTKAAESEVIVGHKLVDELAVEHPELLERCLFFLGDGGYDDSKLIGKLWQEHESKPVIDIRNAWQDGQTSRLVEGLENVGYDFKGTVYCCCPRTGELREMAYGGFEKDRETLKYRCPAEHYGIECPGKEDCPVGKAVGIPRSEDRRVFTPLARSSYKWQREYEKRSAVERVNSRMNELFNFDDHYVRA